MRVLVHGIGLCADALLALMLSLVLTPGADQALVMGADLPTMAFALLDGVIAVTWTLWFTTWLRGRWPTHGALLGRAARASYAPYVIHPLVLTTVLVAFAPVALAPEIKFLLVAAAGVGALLYNWLRADPGARYL